MISKEIIDQLFSPKRALVLGDLMVDVYTRGRVQRISPEAPVPIIHVVGEETKPGGAGNAILNMVSLGMEVVVFGRVGNDGPGYELIEMVEREGIDPQGIFIDHSFITPVKRRMIADNNQQLLRVDYEKIATLDDDLADRVQKRALALIDSGVDIVAFSDYGKGFLTKPLIRSIIDAARARNILVIVDPKGRDFSRYWGATLIKPNYQETVAASGLDSHEPLEVMAKKIIEETAIDHLMVTRASEGISLFDRLGQARHFSANVREVRDVTGAGDTAFAWLAHTMAHRFDLGLIAQLCNIASGLAIERSGCARIGLDEVRARCL